MITTGVFTILGVSAIFSRYWSFLLFSTAMVLYTRTFSHLNAGIYVTEFYMGMFLLSMLLSLIVHNKINLKVPPFSRLFACLGIIALVSLCRGLLIFDDVAYVFRQAAILYYAAFYFIVFYIFDSIRKIRIFFMCVLCAVFSVALIRSLNLHPGFLGNIGEYAYFFESLVFVFLLSWLMSGRKVLLNWFFVLVAILLFWEVLMSYARAAWIGLTGVLLCALLLSFREKIADRISGRIIVAGMCMIIIIMPFLLTMRTLPGDSLIAEAASISPFSTRESTSLNNTRWRLYVWKDILKETAKKPLLGYGFGKAFIPPTIVKLGWGGSWQVKGFQDPHNSFLSVFHRTGIVGLGLLLYLIISFTISTMRSIRSMRDTEIARYMFGLLLCMMCIIGISTFMVVLEGPYLGIFFWVIMGLIASLERISNAQEQTKHVA